jgi:hypothetical protein
MYPQLGKELTSNNIAQIMKSCFVSFTHMHKRGTLNHILTALKMLFLGLLLKIKKFFLTYEN